MSVINCLVAFTCLTFACAPLASGWSLPGWVSTAGNAIGSWVDNTLLPQSTKGCPPTGFDSLQGFDVLDYISAPWYVQWQQPISYQPKDSLYCGRFSCGHFCCLPSTFLSLHPTHASATSLQHQTLAPHSQIATTASPDPLFIPSPRSPCPLPQHILQSAGRPPRSQLGSQGRRHWAADGHL